MCTALPNTPHNSTAPTQSCDVRCNATKQHGATQRNTLQCSAWLHSFVVICDKNLCQTNIDHPVYCGTMSVEMLYYYHYHDHYYGVRPKELGQLE